MFTHNGKSYIGTLQVSANLIAMLDSIGVSPTEKTIAGLAQYCGDVLYTSAIKTVSGDLALAIQGNALVQRAAGSYKVTSAVNAAFSAWELAKAAAGDAVTRKADIIAGARAFAQSMGMDEEQMVKDLTLPADVTEGLAGVADALVTYASALHTSVKAHVRQRKAKAAIKDYAIASLITTPRTDKAGPVTKVADSEGVMVLATFVPLPGRKSGTKGGTRGSFMKPTAIAGISWTESYKTMASQLLAAGVLEDGDNGYKRPSLERFARDMPDKVFSFESGDFTGAQVLGGIENFRVPPKS